MSDSSLFFGTNAAYALALYEQYRENPQSVDAESRAFFDRLGRSPVQLPAPQTLLHASDAGARGVTIGAAAARLARFIRQRGHLEADVDPLRMRGRHDAELAIAEHGLTDDDLRSLPSSVVGGPIAETTENAYQAIQRLREVYSGSIGYDDEHIQNKEERYWLRNAAESGRFFDGIDNGFNAAILERLTEVDTFEQYIDKTWPKEKRFSIEGTDMMVPMLDEIISSAAAGGVREVVLAMAHRGRLNVLTHVLGKPYQAILSAFDDKTRPRASVSGVDNSGYTGDVKYHLGYHREYKETGVAEMPVTLVPNPSHLEFVNPVAVGHARAAQEDRSSSGPPKRDGRAALAILIHGDAAFPGQGIVAETLNLSRLKGYSTDGSIHIIANNQIGFTTDPEDGRSTEYASDLAKGFEIPIIHVNADDPIACIVAARMACAYRELFHKDFLIDLIGYRRYGHNEGDNPEFTQPVMYREMAKHRRLREIWSQNLVDRGVIKQEQADAMVARVWQNLTSARNSPIKHAAPAAAAESAQAGITAAPEPAAEQLLLELNAALLKRPDGFQGDPKLERRVLQPRAKSISEANGISWGHAEELAYAVTLASGTPIRLSGQDCERGTFGHRNAVLHDMVNGQTFTPLQSLPQARASFCVVNSPLSENAAMGFEYGYSVRAARTLIVWEAQFGDFANGAQVIVDQFLASGMAKWQQASSLVLLLPHGYEGQGPEHSSGRLERYLQLAANNNICVANCTTAAQFYHLLRRQVAMLAIGSRPLIVITPKSLLRHGRSACSLSDLTHGGFQTVINDADAAARARKVTRLILCSGKIYMDMVYENTSPYDPREAFANAERVALARIEQLYPFPEAEIKQTVSGYPNLREILWMQEEPKNMGAWTFMERRLRTDAGWDGPINYAGRPEAASPAEGSITQHNAEQARVLELALSNVPEVHVEMPEGSEIETWGQARRTK